MKITSPRLFAGFLRAISGIIARTVLGAQRGEPKGKKFWDARPFTRIVAWGKAYTAACRYLIKNQLEAVGFAVEIRRSGKPRSKDQLHWPGILFG